MKKIFFFNADKKILIKHKNASVHLICVLFKAEEVSIERINYIFCSDRYLLKINEKYLKHITLTDVITFALSKSGEPVFAEIYISIDRIKENAKTYKVKYQNELLRVMLHGALHLCGYKDKTKSDKQKMRAKEDYYLSQFQSFT